MIKEDKKKGAAGQKSQAIQETEQRHFDHRRHALKIRKLSIKHFLIIRSK